MYWLRILGNVVATYVWQRTACACFETYWLRMLGNVLATMPGNLLAAYAWRQEAAWRNVELSVYRVRCRRNE